MAVITQLRLKDLSLSQVSALRRKAKRLGVTAEDYVKQLIADDLELDRKAATTTLYELAAPFRKALNGVSEGEIDHIVDSARRRARRR